MSLALPYTLTAGEPEDISDVQANFTTIADAFPLACNSTNFSSVPQVRVHHSTTQALSNGSVVAFDTEIYDTGTASNNMHDTVTNNSRLICRVAGLYLIHGNIHAETAASTDIIKLRLNGSTILEYVQAGTSFSSQGYNFNLTTAYRLEVSDYVEMLFDGPSTPTVGRNASYSPIFMMYWVSP